MSACIEMLSRVDWRPGIGDPTFMGWFTVVCYFATAYLCARAAGSVQSGEVPGSRRGSRAFWVILTGMFLVLGVNKQLDLQTLLTQVGRELAIVQGWYGERQHFQRQFVICTAILGVAALVFFGVLIRRTIVRQGSALIGAILVVCFVVIRASSLHDVDHALGGRIGHMRTYWILELTGIVCAGIGAIINIRREKKDGG